MRPRAVLAMLVHALVIAIMALGTLFVGGEPAAAQALTGKALILGPTVTGGASSQEAEAAVALGLAVDVVTAAQWSAMTAAQFASYRVIILGDPTCQGPGATAAAEANTSVWGPVVTGNVLIVGTDEVFHNSQGGEQLTNRGIAFAADQEGKTGAYVSLSCYYHETALNTPVPVLDAFVPGGFTVRGVGCYDDVHKVADHPALSGITDATLSNWSCSVHEAFDKWPVSFEVLAIARGIGAYYTAPDGSQGTPYILARGVTVISDIRLAPETATSPVGTSHTLTATVTEGSTPTPGKTITFSVVDGPHIGRTGTGVTNANGVATFSYTGATLGTDTIEATFVDSQGRTQRSNRVTKTWTAPQNRRPAFNAPTPADGTVFNIVVGQNLAFPVNASDPDAGDTVAIAIVNQPAAATFATTPGNPAVGSFSFTPISPGSLVLNLTATDQAGLGATPRSLTINVSPILTVTKEGDGSGRVASSPAGIDCGADCSEGYAGGTPVTLTATPADGSVFAGWGGACAASGASPTCTVTVAGAEAVTARFDRVNAGVIVALPPSVGPSGDRALGAALKARAGCGPIRRIEFGTPGRSFDNARVTILAPASPQGSQTGGFVYTPPAGTTTVSFLIQRVVQQGGATVSPIRLQDGCGEWVTLAGGGADAFR